MLNKNNHNRFVIVLCLIFTMMLFLPVSGFAEAALSEAVGDAMPPLAVAEVPDDGYASEDYDDAAANEEAPVLFAAPEEGNEDAAYDNAIIGGADKPVTILLAGENEETFTGNKIGKWLDRTFYSLDYAIFTAFSKLQNDALTAFFNAFTHLGDTEFAIPMLALGLILSFFKKTRKYGITLFLAILIGTLFTNVVLKNLCGRARPYVTLAGDTDFMSWYSRAGMNIESDNSFPSGHTTCAFEIATALFLSFKNKKAGWLVYIYAVLIMCSRIYLMVHYPTDVFVGVIVGTVAGIIGYAVCKKLLSIKAVSEFDLAAKLKKS